VAAEATYWMAKCELRRGEFASAATRLGEAIQRFPQSELRAEMHYDRAIALLRAGDADGAIKALEEFASQFPDHALAADSLHLLAVTEHRQGQYDKSRSHAKAFTERHPKDEAAASVAFLSGENAFLSGRFDEAAEGYRDVLARFPNDAQADRARFRLATTLYRLERFDEAVPLFEQVVPKAKGDDVFRPALLALGDICFQRGEWRKAEEHLSAYLSVSGEAPPSADDALMKLAYSRQRREKSEDALRDYDLLIDRFSQSPHRLQAFYERGQILAALTRFDEAKASFDRVLAEGGDSRFAGPALNHLAAIALHRNDAAEAASLYERAAKSAGDGTGEVEAVFRQGQALMEGGQYTQAEAAFRRVVERAGTAAGAEARARLAIALSRQERFAEALTVMEQVERKSEAQDALDVSLRTALHYERAWCLRATGRSDEAIKAYRAVLAGGGADPVCCHAMLELAELESAAKRYEEATKVLEGLKEALAKDASLPAELRDQCLHRLAVCEFERQRFDEAARLFEEMISQFPRSQLLASASFHGGEASFKAGRHERAIAHFMRVVKDFGADPLAGPAMLRLCECQAILQRWPASEQVCGDYLSRFADDPQWFAAQFGIGWARENQARYDDAIEAYQRVVERHQGPTAARAQFQIGQCLFAQKKLAPAIRELMKVDILYAYPEWSAAALYEAGRCFAQLGDGAQARSQFTTLTERFKDTKWATLASKQLSELSSSAAGIPGR